jgi:hypothetical protein
MKPGDLVQVREGVFSGGKVGVVLRSVDDPVDHRTLLMVLFHDGPRRMHPYNLLELDAQGKEKA